MTERIREIGGKLEINSGATGTEIVARVPVRKRPAQPVFSAQNARGERMRRKVWPAVFAAQFF